MRRQHMVALLDLADGLGLAHLFTAWNIRDGTSSPDGSGRNSGRTIRPAPGRRRSVRGRTRRSAKRLKARTEARRIPTKVGITKASLVCTLCGPHLE